MKTITTKYPIDILLCLCYSIILLPVIIFNMNEIYRIILGIPFILFIPGYLLLLCIFPKNTVKSDLNKIFKFGMSIGLSISLIPLIGILLYYSFGLDLITILSSIYVIILISGIVAIYRWKKIQKRWTISFHLPNLKSRSKLDKILMIFVFLTIILTIITAVFISFTPKKQESFTEFYILGPDGKNTTNYPKDLIVGQNSNVTIGLINHEYKTITYTIEIWRIKQTLNTTTNEINYSEMWFLDKITVRLNHFTINKALIWQPQWKYLYSFNINQTGNYTLMFLLFTTPTPDYNKTKEFQYNAAKIKIQSAYSNIYLWLNIKK